jgi:uncharacterized protein
MKKLRLTKQELLSIKKVFIKHFGVNDHLWLFGSRVDPNKRGGDIDVYIETNNKSADQLFDQKINFLVDLKTAIGDQKIDVIINRVLVKKKPLLIYKEAKTTGVQLI